MTTGARRTVSVVNAVAMMAMQGGYAPSQSARQVIPVPPGEEARAQEILGVFRMAGDSQPKGAVLSHMPSSVQVSKPMVAAIRKVPALLGVQHDPVLLRRSARRCVIATVILLFGGLGMFLLAMPIDSGRPAGSEPSSLATFVEVVGLFAWVFSPATLVMSIVQWFRSRR
jgi:hypothetical protein